MRWINTKVVRDLGTGQLLERTGYWYEGPVEACDTEAIGKIANIGTLATSGLGLVGNIMNSITRGKAIGRLEDINKLTPQQLAAKVAAARQPLDRALVENIENQVQADVATRGLSQAPGVFAAEESQALAPAEQANLDRAMQLVLAQWGIPNEILAATSGPGSDPTTALMMLMLRNQLGAGGGNQVPSTDTGLSEADVLGQIIAAQSGGLTPASTPPPVMGGGPAPGEI